MKQRLKTTLVIVSIIAAAGCRSADPLPANTVRPAPGPVFTPLDEYRRVLSAFEELQTDTQNLRPRLAAAREEIDDLYRRLSEEQKLRREAVLALEAARAQIEAAAAARQTIDNLQTALHAAKTELATVKTELKTRREELMRIILEQQEWNKYVLDRLKLQ